MERGLMADSYDERLPVGTGVFCSQGSFQKGIAEKVRPGLRFDCHVPIPVLSFEQLSQFRLVNSLCGFRD